MAKLTWDQVGERRFETGVDRGVLYLKGTAPGVPWNGLMKVEESPTGGEATPRYLDGIKYLNEAGPEEYEATIEAYTYPDEFANCNGEALDGGLSYGQQERMPFDLSYRTLIGNDVEGTNFAYKIHLIYNALAGPTQAGYQTLGASTDPVSFSWPITTMPVPIPGFMPSAHVVIDSTKLRASTLEVIEDYLYGTELVEPRMLYPEQLKEILPWLYFEIVPNPETGLNALVLSETVKDVRGDPEVGLYKRTPRSRLVETATPGIYSLDI